MNFFKRLLVKRGLSVHNGKALWKYSLNQTEIEELQRTLKYSTRSNINPKDIALYYAHWWKNFYNGGIPSKLEIRNSVGGNIVHEFTEEEFYQLARKGAQALGIKWIKKQNTLYFKTLLLQGGLPLRHISNHKSNYKAFLEAVLEEQPETIEDFMFNSSIINLLPKSSQNEIIYQNSLEIVNSILSEDGVYEELLESDNSLKEISDALKVKKAGLKKRQQQSRPRIFWALQDVKNNPIIKLRVGFASIYTKEALSAFMGFETTQRNYQLYINDNLVCVFRKLYDGRYKTDWYNQDDIVWEPSSDNPVIYIIANDKKIDLPDFLQHIPNLNSPTLWNQVTDDEWKLVKGNNSSSKEAILLFPQDWKQEYHRDVNEIKCYGKNMFWMSFEGQAKLTSNDSTQIFQSEVTSFEWVIQSQKPNWMLKSNLPVTRGLPKLLVFDESGSLIKRSKYRVFIKPLKRDSVWEDISRLKYIQSGYYDLRIEKDSVTAYDSFFNIDKLNVVFDSQTINSAEVSFINKDFFECQLFSNQLLEISIVNNTYKLSTNTQHGIIPSSIKGTLNYNNKKKLSFHLQSPFQGMALTNKNGQIIEEGTELSLMDLYGLRVLSTPDLQTVLTLKNTLKPDVIINKEIKSFNQPLIAYKDEIIRLFYLADAMDFKNMVTLELSEANRKKFFRVSRFSHSLDVAYQLESKLRIYKSNDKLNLYAVPVSCMADDIEIIPLVIEDDSYRIPNNQISNQFIIISDIEDYKQLMPRFVNTGDFFLGIDKDERINNFHRELRATNFNDDIWKQVLNYFKICVDYDIPFSTFDQLRAVGMSSEVASKAFLFLGINQEDPIDYIQKSILEIEKDLGFCFHWITKKHWDEAIDFCSEYYRVTNKDHIKELCANYFEEIGMWDIFLQIFFNNSIQQDSITNAKLRDLRSSLSSRVLNELPRNSPFVTDYYGIPINHHTQVTLLIQSPIAVAESISGVETNKPIWAGNAKRDVIRRNIQYSQYLNPQFYNNVILHVLKKIK